MSWRVLEELGVEYAEGDAKPSEPLRCPSLAERAADGSTLVVDELATEKCVPIRAESRTLRVGRDGAILYDSKAHGIDDGYGRLIEGGRIAILRRTQWTLEIVSAEGRVVDTLDLSAISKRQPRIHSWTKRGTLLVAFLDKVGELDLAEIDLGGRLLWWLASPEIGVPGSLELLDDGHLLIADEVRHVAVEIDRAGAVVWSFGERGQPSADPRHLSSPKWVTRLGDGQRLIADTRNHRVLRLGKDGSVHRIAPPTATDLWAPASAARVAGGNYLISDAGNRCVFELDGDGRVAWRFGRPVASRRRFSFPRSVEVRKAGDRLRYLVCDTAHNRVLEIEDGAVEERPFEGEQPLFWPRCARWSGDRAIVVADGRNRRIVEIGPDGRLLREIHELRLAGAGSLGDPHDVRALPNGHLLIVDPSRDLVLEADWSGRVQWTLGEADDLRLDDPHSAQLLPDGRVLISDTGHDRLLLVGPDGRNPQAVDAVRHDGAFLRLSRPRYAEIDRRGRLVIVDTGNNRVLATDGDRNLLWQLVELPGSPLPRLSQPRWAHLLGRDEVVVCDHYHHRILRLSFRPE